MKYVFWIVVVSLCYSIGVRKYKNPYKLFMVFGKKGSGKSAFLVRQAIKYQKKGYIVYTNMSDCCHRAYQPRRAKGNCQHKAQTLQEYPDQ